MTTAKQKCKASNSSAQIYLDMKEKFSVKVQNRFEALNEIIESKKPKVFWEQMKSLILASAEEILPKPRINKKKRWMTDDILQLMEQRRLKKTNPLEYKLIDKEIKKKCSEAREKWLNEQSSEIVSKLSVNTKYAHQKINEITGKSRCTSSGCIKAKNRTILLEKSDILNRWSEYIEELFDDSMMPKPIL
jgi:hypothetical protein